MDGTSDRRAASVNPAVWRLIIASLLQEREIRVTYPTTDNDIIESFVGDVFNLEKRHCSGEIPSNRALYKYNGVGPRGV